jgi:hypothetical protein
VSLCVFRAATTENGYGSNKFYNDTRSQLKTHKDPNAETTKYFIPERITVILLLVELVFPYRGTTRFYT